MSQTKKIINKGKMTRSCKVLAQQKHRLNKIVNLPGVGSVDENK